MKVKDGRNPMEGACGFSPLGKDMENDFNLIFYSMEGRKQSFIQFLIRK